MDVFGIPAQDRLWRQQFFYNAFRALSANGIDGDYAEFGCWSGGSFWLAHTESCRHGHDALLWAFDSFQGLPPPKGPEDDHRAWFAGNMEMSLDTFHDTCARDGIPPSRYAVVPGFYHDTLEKMSTSDAPLNIALAFIDCDMYSSAQSVFRFLMPRLKHGMIIAVDDYHCWSPTQVAGERRAMLEAFSCQDSWRLRPFMRYGYHSESFVVESDAALSRSGSGRV